MMSDLKVLETFEKYQTSTEDMDLRCAIRIALDWRSAATYYQDMCRTLQTEVGQLRDELFALKNKKEQCECGLIKFDSCCDGGGI